MYLFVYLGAPGRENMRMMLTKAGAGITTSASVKNPDVDWAEGGLAKNSPVLKTKAVQRPHGKNNRDGLGLMVIS